MSSEGNITAKEFTYKTTPQAELQMLVTFPAGWHESAKLPGIVFFFGGGWVNGTLDHFRRQAEYFAGRGMIAARADYRVKNRHDVTPLSCVEDAKSAVRWLRVHADELGLDADRLVGSGGSAGAHLAACTVMTDGLDAAGEDLSVSSAVRELVLFNPALDMLPQWCQKHTLTAEQGRSISPMRNLREGLPATLLMFGEEDQLCRGWDEFVEKSTALGNRVELQLASGEGHGFFNQSPWFERTLHRADEFLETLGYVAGPPAIELP